MVNILYGKTVDKSIRLVLEKVREEDLFSFIIIYYMITSQELYNIFKKTYYNSINKCGGNIYLFDFFEYVYFPTHYNHKKL